MATINTLSVEIFMVMLLMSVQLTADVYTPQQASDIVIGKESVSQEELYLSVMVLFELTRSIRNSEKNIEESGILDHPLLKSMINSEDPSHIAVLINFISSISDGEVENLYNFISETMTSLEQTIVPEDPLFEALRAYEDPSFTDESNKYISSVSDRDLKNVDSSTDHIIHKIEESCLQINPLLTPLDTCKISEKIEKSGYYDPLIVEKGTEKDSTSTNHIDDKIESKESSDGSFPKIICFSEENRCRLVTEMEMKKRALRKPVPLSREEKYIRERLHLEAMIWGFMICLYSFILFAFFFVFED